MLHLKKEIVKEVKEITAETRHSGVTSITNDVTVVSTKLHKTYHFGLWNHKYILSHEIKV